MHENFSHAPTDVLKSLRGVCLDIDDTLSSHGKLTAEAYDALWALKNAGFHVIPVTGRPAGWCDQIARFWPVDAVVGENGAFNFYLEKGVRKRIDTPAGAPTAELKAKLKKLETEILAHFPHAKWASDQAYREYDLAIDICEDVPTWKSSDVDALLKLCHDHGAHAKLSSIHVNTWYGEYDKETGFKNLVASRVLPLPTDLKTWIYIGDSPNDEPMFSFFPYSVGVANLGKYVPRLKTPPRWMTSGESGAGFAEMARRLIQCKSA